MRAAVILDLPGHFGPIESSGIWNRVSGYQLDRLYFDIRQINRQIIDYCRSRSTLAGINIDPKAWFNEDLAAGALRTTKKLNELGFTGANAAGLCPVMFDYEEHSIEKVIRGLQAWRKTRYKRDTVWTFEPLQGGWVGDPQLQVVVKPDRNLTLMPQAYRGGMQPVAHDAVLEDLTRFYAPQQVRIYYQTFYKLQSQDVGYPVHEAWDGCVYDLEHLPLPAGGA
jgi:hypothetical protein